MDILHVFGIRSCRSCRAGNSSIRKNDNMQQQLNSDVLHKENGKKMVYILSCRSKKWQTDGTLNIVSDTSVLYFADTELDMESLESCTWNFMRNIDVSVTGHKRNHNCGFIRDKVSLVSGKPPVLCTVADNSLWEYRIKLID